jgi:hypothetical protein
VGEKMRAVKGNLGHSFKEGYRESEDHSLDPAGEFADPATRQTK